MQPVQIAGQSIIAEQVPLKNLISQNTDGRLHQ